MKKHLVLLATLLLALALAAPGCAANEEGGQSPEGILSPEQAFELVLDKLREAYPDKAPGAGVTWKSEEVVVTGHGGEPVVGASRMRIYSDDWDSLVSWALVSPEYMVYNVTLRSPTRGWYWEGYVDANGGAIEIEVALQKMSEQMAGVVAWDYMEASPTWMFDGIEGTLEQVEARKDESPYSWTFVFEFESAHAGYGNRAGQVLAQVVTPHQAVISVGAMEVTSAVMDEKWNMMTQSTL